MKKERIIYFGLAVSILALFSFELVLERQDESIDMISISPVEIHSLSIDISANVYFTSGDENKVLLEGQSALLKFVRLNENNGHLSLKMSGKTNLYSHLKSYLWNDETLNLYIVSTNIEDIKVTDDMGIAMYDALFNEDKGILRVKNQSLAQHIRALRNKDNCEVTTVCAQNKNNNFTTCL